MPKNNQIRDNWGVTMYARPEDMSANDGVTEWSKRSARAMDRKRKTGSVESEYWAPLITIGMEKMPAG